MRHGRGGARRAGALQSTATSAAGAQAHYGPAAGGAATALRTRRGFAGANATAAGTWTRTGTGWSSLPSLHQPRSPPFGDFSTCGDWRGLGLWTQAGLDFNHLPSCETRFVLRKASAYSSVQWG